MNFDWNVLNGIQEILKCDLLDKLMPVVTSLGNAGILWIVIGLVMTISKKHRKTGILVLAGLLMGLIVGNGLVKNLVARPRPCWINEDFNLLIGMPKDFSFPSGHTQASFIAATVITIKNKKMGWILFPIATLIAFSRLYLYVHFPTDVIGGAIMGLIIGTLTVIIGEKIIVRISQDKKKNLQM